MAFIFPDTSLPVPPDVAAGIVRVPPGVSPQWPGGAYFTADGRIVTKLHDASDQPFGGRLQGQQDAGAFTRVEAGPALQAQLDRIEQFLVNLTARG